MAGIDEVTPHISLEGADETSEKFREVGQAAAEMAAKISAALEGIGGAGNGIEKAAEVGKKALTDLGVVGAEAFGKILDAAANGNIVPAVTMLFGHLAGALAEVAEKALQFVEAQASVVETMSNLAHATGMSLTQLEALKDAFASVGISTNGFERSIGRLAITIANEWTQIQQAVRTSADTQVGAMLHVQQASQNLTKAHHEMNAALTQSVSQAAHNSMNIEQSAIGLKKAGEALRDFMLQSRSNSLGIESAELALKRAQLNLLKDQGFDVTAQEKALKIEGDKVAVKEAELRLEEARNKKSKEGLEMEELQLRLKKARQEAIDAENKAIEDSIKMADRLKDARLHEQQAALAVREAQEKQHEADLKNIPAIAKEIENVANGQKKWDDVINHTELSAQNLTKAVILAASGGDMTKQPEALSVFKEMLAIFPKITDEGQKLALIQHTMGAGFRAGQASAAQIAAVMERFGKDTEGGKNALEKLFQETEKFSKVKIGGFDMFSKAKDDVSHTAQALKNFNSAAAQLDTVLDGIKNRFAAILSVPLTAMFEKWKESLLDNEGVMQRLSKAFGNFLLIVTQIASGVGSAISAVSSVINELATVLSKLTGIPAEHFFEGLAAALIVFAGYAVRTVPYIGAITTALGALLIRLVAIPALVGLAITALGDLFQLVAYGWSKMPQMLGGGADNTKPLYEFGKKIEAIGQQVTRTMAKIGTGSSDADIDKFAHLSDKNGGLGKGLFGDSAELKKIMEEPAHEQKSAAADQKTAAQMQLEAAKAKEKEKEKDRKGERDEDDPAGIKANLRRRDQENAAINADPVRAQKRDLDEANARVQQAEQRLREMQQHLAAAQAERDKIPSSKKADSGDPAKDAEAMKSWRESIAAANGEIKGTKEDLARLSAELLKAQAALAKEVARPPAQPLSPEQKEAAAETKAAAVEVKASATEVKAAGADLKTGSTALASGSTELKSSAQSMSQGAQRLAQVGEQFNTVGNVWNTLAGTFAAVVSAFQAAVSGMPKGGGGGGEGKAGGGHIRGPGGPTDDRAGLFALSDNEYVVRSAAVSHYGAPLFEALNNLAVGGFATGGIVGPRGPSLAGPGPSGSSSILNLTIDGNHFDGLKAPESVASKLKTYAVHRQSSSAQKMPTWMR